MFGLTGHASCWSPNLLLCDGSDIIIVSSLVLDMPVADMRAVRRTSIDCIIFRDRVGKAVNVHSDQRKSPFCASNSHGSAEIATINPCH